MQNLQAEPTAGASRRLLLYVDECNRWSPATIKPDQRSSAKLKMRNVRSGKDIIVDRNLVTGFTLGRLNAANGSEKSPLLLKPQHCACCLRPKRRADADTDSQLCLKCRTMEEDCLPSAAEIDAYVRAASPSQQENVKTARARSAVRPPLDDSILCYMDFKPDLPVCDDTGTHGDTGTRTSSGTSSTSTYSTTGSPAGTSGTSSTSTCRERVLVAKLIFRRLSKMAKFQQFVRQRCCF